MTQITLSGSSLADAAIDRIKMYEPAEGYHLAFSGGKDSIVCYDLCVRAGVQFEGHYAVTTIDPPEVLQFIRENYPNIKRDVPTYKGKRTNYYELISKKGLPNRHVRWCCSVLKETKGQKGSTVITGVRREESYKRSKRPVYYEHNGKKILNPIVDWKAIDVWDYIKERQLLYPTLYDEGYNRIGCVMCPLSCLHTRVMDYHRYPNHAKAIIKAIDKFIATHPDSSLKNWGTTAAEIFHIWIASTPPKDESGQCQFEI
ncbi:MAG TPA: phosphoadenosine phosphosulfate reductase family protein [Methanocorpusculum sp.]|nr:phosphoadenosine phosphosulfate reductase family protein [Methanocorpusculum sp.]HJK80528.1 phosphoadenosine phosphosulfate reductase family protein [Methanocorpusculum sp.]